MKSTSLIVCATLVMLTIGCKKDHDTVDLGAKIHQVGSEKVFINGSTPNWHNGDRVWVNGDGTRTISNADGTSAKIQQVSTADNYLAIYPAECVTGEATNPQVTILATQTFQLDNNGNQIVKAPMAAYSANKHLFFYNLCSLVKVTVKNNTGNPFTLSQITIMSSVNNLCGESPLSINTTSGQVTPGGATGEDANQVTLTFNGEDAATINDGSEVPFYLSVAPFISSNDITISIVTTTNEVFSRTRTIESLDRNTIASARLNVTNFINDGEFTINSQRGRVHFSKGNLQFNKSSSNGPDLWRFATHQYDYVGDESNGNVYRYLVQGTFRCTNYLDNTITSTNNRWIDLFGWGTSGFSNKFPYMVSTISTDYGLRYGDIEGTRYDWGVRNSNQLGTGWRTLSKAEWDYILHTRTNVPQHDGTYALYAKVQLHISDNNVVNGLLIFPDNFAMPTGVNYPNTLNSFTVDFTNTQYSITEWEALERAGVVFLPAGGFRSGQRASQATIFSFYWTSTASGNDKAYCITMADGICERNRYLGFSVRLAKDI